MSTMQPFDFGSAHQAAVNETRRQQDAEDFYKTCARDYAMKEEAYRKALAQEIVELRAEKKNSATLCGDLARGDAHVAALKRERDIAEGMKDAALQALWRKAADRRDLGRFIEWSMRVDIAVHASGREVEPEPDVAEIHGRRAA